MSEQQLARFFDDILGISAPPDDWHGTGFAEVDVAESSAETAEDRSSIRIFVFGVFNSSKLRQVGSELFLTWIFCVKVSARCQEMQDEEGKEPEEGALPVDVDGEGSQEGHGGARVW